MRVSGPGLGETWNRVQAQAGAQMEIVNEKQGQGLNITQTKVEKILQRALFYASINQKDNFLAGAIISSHLTINCLWVKNRTREKSPQSHVGPQFFNILPFPLDLLLPEPEDVGCGLVAGVTGTPWATAALLLRFSGGLSTTLKPSLEARLRRFSRTELTSPRGDSEHPESSQLFREATSTFNGCSGEFWVWLSRSFAAMLWPGLYWPISLFWEDLYKARWYSSSCLVIFCSSVTEDTERLAAASACLPWSLLEVEEVTRGCSVLTLTSFFLARLTMATTSCSLV